ncbi:lipopolysaccharide biosynthesis protein [Sphingomonas lenta]|uniref:Lipopolysaccharide biosynthesis protein n=1 Tax=Sphingomonas lenta TaxID=1141887 RepID=A0A2A2SCL8_9SPHN|nr:lipopolysaccharide biosynthesis protein [Sphingomonas lenta]
MSAASPTPNHASDRFVAQVRRAILWRSGSHIVAQAVQWGATFLVIRILQPADYGLFAMTGVVLVLLNLLNGYGMASGVVQRPEVTRREVAQLFGLLIAVNACLAAAQWLLAPAFASYYRQPAVADLLRVQALLYACTPFVALPQALLAREMDFSGQAKANIAGAFAGGATALGGALGGWGVWTLVWAPIAIFATRGLVLTWAVGGLPRPVFDVRGTGALLRFGGFMAAGQFFGFLWTQADMFIGGRHLSAHQLGLYSTALFLAQIFVSKFAPPIHDVAFATYAKLQHDRPAAGRAFLQFARLICVAGMPFHLGLAVTAEPLVLTLLGSQWADAAPIVQVLAASMAFYTVYVLLGPAAEGLGRPGLAAGNNAVAALVTPALLLVTVRWGVIGLAASWAIVFPLLLAIGLHRVLPLLELSRRALFRVVAPPTAAALAMAAVVVLADRFAADLPAPVRLLLLVGLGGAVYGGWMLAFARDALGKLWSLARRR